jgi:hypothetical protein
MIKSTNINSQQHQQAKDEPRSVKKTKFHQFFPAAIALCMIAFLTIGSAPSQAGPKKAHVTINSIYDFGGGYPFPGAFTISGAFEASGTVTMEVNFEIPSNSVFHCLYTFVALDENGDETGTIIIREECVFATPLQGQGRWEIVSGTGAYAGLRGNGSALMPDIRELWEGFIY